MLVEMDPGNSDEDAVAGPSGSNKRSADADGTAPRSKRGKYSSMAWSVSDDDHDRAPTDPFAASNVRNAR